MEAETLNLTTLICDSLNSIFFKIFSSVDNSVYSTLDNIIFIHSDFVENLKFQQIFGDNVNGLLLIANSLIFGIILFYVIHFAMSHLIYSKVDSPYQFLFKCIIFIACMNSSLWICKQMIKLTSVISYLILDVGYSVTGVEVSFSSLIENINSALYIQLETFDIFSINGLLKLCTTLGIVYILLVYSIRYVMCKIFVLLSPFAFLSLVSNRFDGFFKGWIKQFCILLFMQIFVALVLLLGFSLEFSSGDILSKFIYFAIIIIIARCNYSVKNIFSFIHDYSHDNLKDFI